MMLIAADDDEYAEGDEDNDKDAVYYILPPLIRCCSRCRMSRSASGDVAYRPSVWLNRSSTLSGKHSLIT